MQVRLLFHLRASLYANKHKPLPAEFLKLKSHLWGVGESVRRSELLQRLCISFLEQDLQAFSKKENTSVRV